jgi:hypothetical protein
MRGAGVRTAFERIGLLLILVAVFSACSGGGGSGDEPASSNWDELVWDEGDWQ